MNVGDVVNDGDGDADTEGVNVADVVLLAVVLCVDDAVKVADAVDELVVELVLDWVELPDAVIVCVLVLLTVGVGDGLESANTSAEPPTAEPTKYTLPSFMPIAGDD